MSRVLFIRHAETEMAGRFCGHSDPELNAQGRTQLTTLARLLSAEPIDTVYSSDLRRASALRRRSPLFERYRRCCGPHCGRLISGEWEGLELGSRLNRWIRSTRGSGLLAIPMFPRLRGRASRPSRHASSRKWIVSSTINRGPIAVVTHGGVLRVVLRHLCGCSDEEAWQQTRTYCCIVRYE